MENFRVVKVVETVTTLYTLKGNADNERAKHIVEQYHKDKPDTIDIQDGSDFSLVTTISSHTSGVTKVEYQAINDRPQTDLPKPRR